MIWVKMLTFDGIYYWAGFVNIWGDWSAHIIYITNFAYRSFSLPYHPLFWGEPFRYHFVADLLSGMLIRAGATLIQATIVPSIILSIFLVSIVYLFYRTLYKSISVAIVSCLLFFFNGGLGFMYAFLFFIKNDPRIHEFPPLFQMTHIESENIQVINFITDIFIPQRAFLLGMPFAVSVLLFLALVNENTRKSFSGKLWVFFAVLTGSLPLVHINSFFVILIVSSFVTINDVIKKRTLHIRWLIFYLIIATISLPALSYIAQSTPERFLRISPLWMTNGDVFSWIGFWIKNIGVMAVLIPLSLFAVPSRIRHMSIPFFLLFIASNIIIFQSYEWDNRKYFLYWYLFASGMAGYMIVLFYYRGGTVIKNITIFILLLAIISGLIDSTNLLRFEYQKFRLFSVHDMEFAAKVRNAADKNAVFLTAPTNSWLTMLFGRQVVMGLSFWLHTAYGFDTEQRETDIKLIYDGAIQTYELLTKYQIDYVVIGERERLFIPTLNETFFASQYPVLIKNSDTTIYEVR